MMNLTYMFFSLMMLYSAWKTLTNKNPIKTAMGLSSMSITMSLVFFTSTGNAWFSLTFLLAFLGGIIMMFMVLSSVSPNQPTMKNKNVWKKAMILMFIAIIVPKSMMSYPRELSSAKWFLDTASNNLFMIMLMLMYFFIFNEFLKKKDTAMRSYEC